MAVPLRPPGRRPLPTPTETPPELPPSLPPRPGGHRAPPKPPPSHQRDAESDEDYVEPTSDDVYDDCNNEQESFPAPPEDFYDDISNQQPPPMVGRGALPPPPAQNLEPEATYDDFDEQPALPERPPLSKPPPPPPVRESTPPLPPDETYDDLDNAPGPVVQHIPRKLPNLPPPPPGKASNPPKPESVSTAEVDTYRIGASSRGLDPGRSQTYLRPTSPNRSPSPSRSISPGRYGAERSLPPIPKPADSNGSGGSFRQGPMLPPIPTVVSLKKTPVPATRGGYRSTDSEDNSPVVVPLVRHTKTGPPPLPPPQQGKPPPPTPLKPQKTAAAPLPPRNHAVSDEEEERTGSEAEEEPSDSEESEEFENEVDEIQENVYEVTDDSSKSGGGSVSAPSPPPLPPGRTAEARPPKPKPTPPAGTGPKSPAGGAFPVIDATQIQGLKSKLRKVSLDNVEHSPPSAHEPKVYGETGSVSEKLKKFQQKAGDGRPGVALKPVMAKKPNVPAKDSGKSPISNVSNSKPNSLPATPPREKSPTPSAPDVIVIPKKPPQHTNMPLPPLPKETPPPKAPEPVAEYPEEIYDDACSGDTLHQYDWFHGDIDRKSTEAKIHALNKDGTFLVRTSKNDPRFPYTLVVLHEGRINNLRIRERTDGRYALGDEKSDELAFNDVLAMINHHKKNHVVLLGRQHATVVLQQTPPKR